MNPYAIPPLLSAALIGVMGLFVYSRNPKSLLNIRFSLFCLSLTAWLLCFTGVYASHDEISALRWARAGLVGVGFIPPTMYHFVLTFLQLRQPKLVRWLYVSSFVGVAISRTSLGYSGIWTGFWGYYPTAGLLYPVFPIIFCSCFMGGVVRLYLALRRERDALRRQQIKYVMLAFACGTPGIIDYIVKYQVNIYPFGYITALALISWIAYAMVRHRLMEIHIAVTRTGILVGVYALVLIIPAVLATVFRPSLTAILGSRWWLVPQGVFATLALAGPFVYLFFQRRAEANILSEQRRYQATLMNAAKGMVKIRDLKRLLRLIAYLLTRSMKLAHAEIFLWDQKTAQYVLPAYRLKGGKEQPGVVLSSEDPLIKWLQTHRTVVVGEEMGARSDGVLRQEALERLRQLHAAVIVPSSINERLIGFVVLGEKRNGRMFSQDDLNVLQTLASQAALAIENARFFGELQSTQAQLFQSEKMAALGHMGAGLSHQLHNRFMALLKNSGVLLHIELPKMLAQTHWTPEDRQQLQKFVDNLQGIEREAGRGAEIVNKLIKYARLSPDNQLVDLHDVIKEAIGMLHFTAKLDTVDLVYDLPESIPKIRGNFTYLQDVFFNLTDNAYQAIEEKQRRMAARVLPEQPDYKGIIAITARHMEAERKVKVTVHDNGVGMTKEELAQLFIPFFTTKSSSGHGTGMGLFIIKKMIEEAHRGTIEVASTIGVGTSFIVHLPAAKE